MYIGNDNNDNAALELCFPNEFPSNVYTYQSLFTGGCFKMDRTLSHSLASNSLCHIIEWISKNKMLVTLFARPHHHNNKMNQNLRGYWFEFE